MRVSALPIVVCVAVALGGCPKLDGEVPPPPPEKMSASLTTQTLNANVAAHLDSIARIAKSFENSKLLDTLVPAGETGACPPGGPCPEPQPSDLNVDDESKDMQKWLKDHIFNEANVESTDATSVTYRLVASIACAETYSDGGAAPADAKCVKTFTDLAFRVVVTSPAPGNLDLRISVGSSQPATVKLHQDRVVVTVDLAQLRAAADAIATVQGEANEFPQTFEGEVEAALLRNGADDYSLRISVLKDVHVTQDTAQHPEYVDLRITAAPDILTLQGVLASKTVNGALDLKAMDVQAALDLIAGERSSTVCTPGPNPGDPDNCQTTTPTPLVGVLKAHLAGASAQGSLSALTDQLTLTNVGLGNATSTASYGNTQILSVDVNAAANRRFALTVGKADGGMSLQVSPSFNLAVVHDLRSLQGQIKDIETWMLDGTAGLRLDNASAPRIRVLDNDDSKEPCSPDGGCPAAPPQTYVEVIDGRLSLSASGIPAVAVDAPACLVEVNHTGDAGHPFQSVASGPCQ